MSFLERPAASTKSPKHPWPFHCKSLSHLNPSSTTVIYVHGGEPISDVYLLISLWASGIISNLHYSRKHLNAYYMLLGIEDRYNEQNNIPSIMAFKSPWDSIGWREKSALKKNKTGYERVTESWRVAILERVVLGTSRGLIL